MTSDKMTYKSRRSVLFVPASNQRAMEKAKSLSCDAVIFDLEDSVSVEHREQAYQNLTSIDFDSDYPKKEIIIRTTAYETSSFKPDLEIALGCKPDAILLPKVSTADPIMKLEKQLSSQTQIWVMIETPLAIMNLKDICTSSIRIECLVIGPNDLAKETGTKMDRTLMHPWLMNCIVAAKAYGMNVLDGVYNNFRDLDGFETECVSGAAMGFDGKTLIHPSQIDGANKAFSPSENEVERANKIIRAFNLEENKDKAVIQIEGEMVERLHLEKAKTLLEKSK